MVLRNAGPMGAPGMPEAGALPIPKKLGSKGVTDMVRISDARMSGTGLHAQQIEELFTTTARRLGLRTAFFAHDHGTTFARPPRAGRQLTLF